MNSMVAPACDFLGSRVYCYGGLDQNAHPTIDVAVAWSGIISVAVLNYRGATQVDETFQNRECLRLETRGCR